MKTQRDDLIARTRKHANLAIIYAEDGAFATAAKVFGECEVLMQCEHKRRWELMNPGRPLPTLPKRKAKA